MHHGNDCGERFYTNTFLCRAFSIVALKAAGADLKNYNLENIFIAGKVSQLFPGGKMLKNNYFKGLKKKILKERKRE